MKGLESRRRLSDLSPFETYLVCVPAIMLGSILLLGGIILLLEPRKKTDAETLAEIRKALERPGDEFTNGNRPEQTVADILCDQCQTPLIEIDLCGERLSGCTVCNKWGLPGDNHQVMELQPPRTGRSPADFAAVGLLVAAHDCRIDRKKVFGIDSVRRRGRRRRDGGQDARRSQRVSSARAQLCAPSQRRNHTRAERSFRQTRPDVDQAR